MFDPKSKITDLRGKDYLEVKWRLVWFREERKDGTILTEVISTAPLMVKATIMDGNKILATGYGTAQVKQNAVWNGREVEKAETAAIGRALAHAGYGTQFTDEDEGDNLADSPVEKKTLLPEHPTDRRAELVKRYEATSNEAAALNIPNIPTLSPEMSEDEIIAAGVELRKRITEAKK